MPITCIHCDREITGSHAHIVNPDYGTDWYLHWPECTRAYIANMPTADVQVAEKQQEPTTDRGLHYLLVGNGGNEPWGRCDVCGAVKVFGGCLNCIWKATYSRR